MSAFGCKADGHDPRSNDPKWTFRLVEVHTPFADQCRRKRAGVEGPEACGTRCRIPEACVGHTLKSKGEAECYLGEAECYLGEPARHVPNPWLRYEVGQWRHIRANVSAGLLRSRSQGNLKAWAIVIADHAVRGQVDLSMLLPFGSLTPCRSLQVPSMSACSRRRQQARGNTARNVEAI
jgi:hypothetical protein